MLKSFSAAYMMKTAQTVLPESASLQDQEELPDIKDLTVLFPCQTHADFL